MVPPNKLGPDISGLSKRIAPQCSEENLQILKGMQYGQKKHFRCISVTWRKAIVLECKETTLVAMSSAEAEYVVHDRCCAKILDEKSTQ
ncbi:hypothetical protein Tco_1011822 [Tanacetum coccineum]